MAHGLMAMGVEIRRFPGRDANHPVDQVHTTHFLGDAMFDLQARVHFQEIELRRVGVVHKFNRARRTIADGLAQLDRRSLKLRTHRIGESGCRGLFDDLLVATLHRAVALAQCHHAAFAITEELYFDVPRTRDELLEEDAGVLEVVGRQALDRLESLGEFRGGGALLHADATTAGGALEHHRIADARGLAQGRRQVL